MPDNSPAPRSGPLPWLVGLVALWQLAFAPLANLWEFVPRRPTPADHYPELSTTQRWGRFTDAESLQRASEIAGDALAFYGEASGQEQGWNMFTPDFPPHTVVPVAELHFADGTTARVASRFDPPDVAHPRPRWPLVHDREFNFEANITMLGWHAEPDAVAARPEVWRKLPDRVRDNHELIAHWLKWKTHVYRAVHPDAPEPVAVVLIFRYIPTPLPSDPTAPRKPTFERPFARRFPGGSLDGYDPVAEQFIPLKAVTPP